MEKWNRLWLINNKTGTERKLGQLHIIDNEFWSNIELHFEDGSASLQMSLHAFMTMVMGATSFNGLYSLEVRNDT